jgi:hypothetical protein
LGHFLTPDAADCPAVITSPRLVPRSTQPGAGKAPIDHILVAWRTIRKRAWLSDWISVPQAQSLAWLSQRIVKVMPSSPLVRADEVIAPLKCWVLQLVLFVRSDRPEVEPETCVRLQYYFRRA